MFHRLPRSPGGLLGSHPHPHLSSFSPLFFPGSVQTSLFAPGSLLRAKPPPSLLQIPSGARPLPGTLLSPPHPSSPQRPASAPGTRGHRGTPPALHPAFAPSTLPLPPAPQASAVPAPHRSRAPPRNTPPARGPLPHMMPEARSDRKASGERLAKSGAHKSLCGYQRAWG